MSSIRSCDFGSHVTDSIGALRVSELETGFRLLYKWKPAEARALFEAWRKSRPTDPLGNASEATGYLFENVTGNAS